MNAFSLNVLRQIQERLITQLDYLINWGILISFTLFAIVMANNRLQIESLCAFAFEQIESTESSALSCKFTLLINLLSLNFKLWNRCILRRSPNCSSAGKFSGVRISKRSAGASGDSVWIDTFELKRLNRLIFAFFDAFLIWQKLVKKV